MTKEEDIFNFCGTGVICSSHLTERQSEKPRFIYDIKWYIFLKKDTN